MSIEIPTGPRRGITKTKSRYSGLPVFDVAVIVDGDRKHLGQVLTEAEGIQRQEEYIAKYNDIAQRFLRMKLI